MSKIIASAAIRGAHKIAEKAEKALKASIKEFGKDKKVEFPNTGYYLPVIYGMLGIKVEKLGDMEQVMERIKELLPPVPSESLWLPYLGHTLDAGMATFWAEEIIEAIRYLDNPNFYLHGEDVTPDNLWLGA
ncbi:MAG: CO dehydrogenase/CO-methylating acetyl-CoA synthase complex subunit beta, partial [bacterium]